MTFIPKKIRLLPLSVALITTISLGTSVFAAATLQPPITTYDAGTQKVTVSSTVTDVANNEEVTYLVKQTLAPKTDNIIFIDQKNSLLTTSVTFSFTTAYTDLNYAATVNFGTATTVKNTPAVPDLFLTRSITSSTYNGLVRNANNDAESNLTVFGTLTNSVAGNDKASADAANEEYGILFTNTAGAIDYGNTSAYLSTNVTNNNTVAGLTPTSVGVKKFPAWGKTAVGQFGINLKDGGTTILASSKISCDTRTYVIYTKEGTSTKYISFGPVRTLTLRTVI